MVYLLDVVLWSAQEKGKDQPELAAGCVVTIVLTSLLLMAVHALRTLIELRIKGWEHLHERCLSLGLPFSEDLARRILAADDAASRHAEPPFTKRWGFFSHREGDVASS
ncbi:hypothetical protein [Streptomyces sp. SAJ15]|uniref:hypothetical protein n=1 Tax=Streptomyces sp. SAJ15 TaxID=2011095 RepID=UPI001185A90E|nr:hypothetical protein [Streptomyces sp. SAJ15]